MFSQSCCPFCRAYAKPAFLQLTPFEPVRQPAGRQHWTGGTSASVLLLGLLGVAATGLGLAERADGRITVNLLVAGQAGLHRRRLLSVDTQGRRRHGKKINKF